MVLFKKLLAAGLLIPISLQGLMAQSPNLGKPFQEALVPATILTDGTGLPAGSGNAITGRAVFQQHCFACHGSEGRGGINDQLVGGQGTLAGDNPVKTIGSYWPYATTLYDYINRAMPYQSPGSLSSDEIYAITAYLLYKNAIIVQDKVLNATSLPQVAMPNRDNFVWDFREE